MPGWLDGIIGNELVTATIIGALAWLIGKAWDLQHARRARYAEVLQLLTAPGTRDDLGAVAPQLARLWVEAPTPVVTCSESLLDAIAAGGPERADRLVQLAIAMRRDTALFAWFNPQRWRRLQPGGLRLRFI